MAQASVLEARDAGVAAEAEGEVFETFSEDGTPLGREFRSVCHAHGIWHRAVYAYLFNALGQLLIQRRSLNKKVAPGQWDLSVAEHLSPGETFRDGVVRGLAEELGVELSPQQLVALQGPLTPMHQRRLLIPEKGIKDFEFIEAYRLDGYEGPISFNEQEVIDCKWVSLEELQEEMSDRPDDFTIWFREEIQSLNFFKHTS
ncbi:hypothetical protein Vretimale_7634 [Volvox reticuliferus]|uniref:Uncharacterized protein n=1 Tax=Volvox reticuliferus TaxID=1737510 RepID=A0A8J4C979_9CHLO|nr:hypothetical protein Vretifemale_7671 [Volvox reticuliferus]GIM02786.1 hypothetical protein Vretimale_7634 [Volvox reticuliferus]